MWQWELSKSLSPPPPPPFIQHFNQKEMRWHLFCRRAGDNIKCNFTGYLDGSWADKRLSAATGLFGPISTFFFFRGGECSGRRTATWQRRDETIGALCCFIAFAAAAFEFIAEQEAVMRGTTNTTYRLAFVFATLCRRHCAGAFSSSFDPTACGPPAPGFVSAVLVLQRP